MSNIINEIAENLGIETRAVSRNLQFIKSSKTDTVWHIADWSIADGSGRIGTLHAENSFMMPHLKADSLVQLSLQETGKILLCEGCVNTFLSCYKMIQERDRTRFAVKDVVAGSETALQVAKRNA